MRRTKFFAQIMGILALAMTLVMTGLPVSAAPAADNSNASFNDIDGPYRDAILWINARGAMVGYNQNTFGTNDPLLREQAAAVLGRMRSWQPASTSSCFPDLADRDEQLARFVCRLAQYGVINGYGDGLFRPGNTVSEIEMVAFITRTMWASGLWPPSTPDPGYYPNITGSLRPAVVMYAYMAGPINGSPDIYGDLNNANTGVSRGFAAQLIYQAFQNCGYLDVC